MTICCDPGTELKATGHDCMQTYTGQGRHEETGWEKGSITCHRSQGPVRGGAGSVNPSHGSKVPLQIPDSLLARLRASHEKHWAWQSLKLRTKAFLRQGPWWTRAVVSRLPGQSPGHPGIARESRPGDVRSMSCRLLSACSGFSFSFCPSDGVTPST